MWTDDSWVPNTIHGIILWGLKIVGFVLLTVGVWKVTNLWAKIREKWREIMAEDENQGEKYQQESWG
jgi:hypothetical protein